MDDERFGRAIAAIDAANTEDPTSIVVGGVERPKEVAHAEMVSGWVTKLDPAASEALLLAARAHHLRRWTIPRASYPTGRAGYLKWRKTLHAQHADEVAAILVDLGYDEATIARVQDLVRKRGLGSDPEMQALEDAMCLVFIETQLADLAARLAPETLPGVIAKTKKKMSPEAIGLALQLPLSDAERELLLAE